MTFHIERDRQLNNWKPPIGSATKLIGSFLEKPKGLVNPCVAIFLRRIFLNKLTTPKDFNIANLEVGNPGIHPNTRQRLVLLSKVQANLLRQALWNCYPEETIKEDLGHQLHTLRQKNWIQWMSFHGIPSGSIDGSYYRSASKEGISECDIFEYSKRRGTNFQNDIFGDESELCTAKIKGLRDFCWLQGF